MQTLQNETENCWGLNLRPTRAPEESAQRNCAEAKDCG